MNTLQNDRPERITQNTPYQQSQKTDYKHNMSYGIQDCATRSDTPQNIIIKSGQSLKK